MPMAKIYKTLLDYTTNFIGVINYHHLFKNKHYIKYKI